MGYAYVAGTLAFASYSQLIVKWRIDKAGDFPDGLGEKLEYLGRFLIDPWVISAGIAVLVSALCWFAALTQLDLNRAYPFMGATFVIVLLGSGIFFSEAVTLPKVLGVTLIVAGIVVSTR